MDVNKGTEVKVEPKKVWSNPELVAYGAIEDITNGGIPKVFGSSDGFSWAGADIKNGS